MAARRLLDLDQALQYLQTNQAFLHYDERNLVDIWSPHKKLPIAVRRSVYANREQAFTYLLVADSRVCPAPTLHKKRHWRRRSGQLVCLACLRMDDNQMILSQEKTA